jgi:hypothetical protein
MRGSLGSFVSTSAVSLAGGAGPVAVAGSISDLDEVEDAAAVDSCVEEGLVVVVVEVLRVELELVV